MSEEVNLTPVQNGHSWSQCQECPLHSTFDPMYESVSLPAIAGHIVRHPYFVRTQFIHQLGLLYTVRPQSAHCRGEHMIGTAILAQEAVNAIKKTTMIDARWETVIIIAALVHDLGHAPTSHVFERYLDRHGIPSSHEDRTNGILYAIANDISCNLCSMNLTEIIPNIMQLICANKDTYVHEAGRAGVPPAFFEIVSNKGLDVDRTDYLCRDMHSVVSSVFPPIDTRGIYSRVLVDKKTGHLMYSLEDYQSIRSLLIRRYVLHLGLYSNPDAVALELSLMDFLDTLYKRDEWEDMMKGCVDSDASQVKRFCELDEKMMIAAAWKMPRAEWVGDTVDSQPSEANLILIEWDIEASRNAPDSMLKHVLFYGKNGEKIDNPAPRIYRWFKKEKV